MKAVVAAACLPCLAAKDINTDTARRHVERLGSFAVPPSEAASAFKASRRLFEEEMELAVASAGRNGSDCCEACIFQFLSFHGEIGRGFIERHVSTGADLADPRCRIERLCANCHRMMHRREPALSLDELKDHIERAQRF